MSMKKLRREYLLKIKKKGLTCYLCGELILNKKQLSLDHVIPKCRGGTNNRSNIQPTHAACNEIKAFKLLSELTAFEFFGKLKERSGK